MRLGYIYMLTDSIRHCFYIGKSINHPKYRLKNHIRDAVMHDPSNPYKNAVINKILGQGRNPLVKALLKVPTLFLNVVERLSIAVFPLFGVKLTNLTKGGEGTYGYKWTKEQCENLKVSMNDPVLVKSQSKTTSKVWRRKGYKQMLKEIFKKARGKKGANEKRAKSMQLVWQDTNYRKKLIAIQSVSQNKPSTRKKRSIAMNLPSTVQKIQELTKKAMHTEDVKQKHAKGLQLYWESRRG